jgi:hypothetical protein
MKELCVRCNSKWYDDLMLPQAWRRYQASGGQKRRLHDYATRFAALLGFFRFLGENSDELSELDLYALVQEMPNPRLRAFTSEHRLETMFEMDRFLRILGDQTVQVTLEFAGGREVSWVLKAADGRVEYVDCIDGHVSDATVSINVPMQRSMPTPGAIIRRVLTDSNTWRRRADLTRLAAAVGHEVATMLASHAAEHGRHRAASTWRRVQGHLGLPRSRAVRN